MVSDEPPWPQANPHDWLTLEQAACELGVSVSTVRRRMRRGELRNRIVPRRGGFAYRIYIAGSRHGREPELHGHPSRPARAPRQPHDLAAYRRERAALQAAESDVEADDAMRHLEQQVERLSAALTTALRPKRPGGADAVSAAARGADEPYARYRQLVRKRRWWPF
ncbi:MAG: hypothetical protein IVW36_03525 [Dehalococcoidia bacterium]|nr:hypothetical protein [Dehalococcoidia bacterium]